MGFISLFCFGWCKENSVLQLWDGREGPWKETLTLFGYASKCCLLKKMAVLCSLEGVVSLCFFFPLVHQHFQPGPLRGRDSENKVVVPCWPSKGYFVKPATPAGQWTVWLFVSLIILKGGPNKHSCPRIGCPFPLFKKLFTEDKVVYSAADLHNVCFVSTWESNPGDTVPWRPFWKHLGCKT